MGEVGWCGQSMGEWGMGGGVGDDGWGSGGGMGD